MSNPSTKVSVESLKQMAAWTSEQIAQGVAPKEVVVSLAASGWSPRAATEVVNRVLQRRFDELQEARQRSAEILTKQRRKRGRNQVLGGILCFFLAVLIFLLTFHSNTMICGGPFVLGFGGVFASLFMTISGLVQLGSAKLVPTQLAPELLPMPVERSK